MNLPVAVTSSISGVQRRGWQDEPSLGFQGADQVLRAAHDHNREEDGRKERGKSHLPGQDARPVSELVLLARLQANVCESGRTGENAASTGNLLTMNHCVQT